MADYDPNLGQDYRDPAVAGQTIAASPQPAPAPMPMAAPASRVMGSSVMSPDQLESREFWRKMNYQLEGQPLDQAEAALAAAVKFQGIRGYQKDLEQGKPAAEALARWAPMMFNQQNSAGWASPMLRSLQRQPLPSQVRGIPVVDPKTGQPMPGFMAFPSATGQGTVIHRTQPEQPEISPSAAGTMLGRLGELEGPFPGVGTNLGPRLMERVEAGLPKRVAPPAAAVTPMPPRPVGRVVAPVGQPPARVPKGAWDAQPGDVYKGYRFKGGDWHKKENWEKV